MYALTAEEISALFMDIAGFAAAGSTVVFDFGEATCSLRKCRG